MAHTSSIAQSAEVHNELTPEELKAGWVLLFDGETLNGWHTFNASGIDPRWSVQHGELVLAPSPARKVSGADLETNDRFRDFELVVEWQISPEGNSGIIYRVDGTDYEHPWECGPEYQLLDNSAGDGLSIHQAGSVWDLYAPARDATLPIGQFNRARIIVHNSRVEHWMNEVKLLEYQLGSQDFAARHAKSAWKRFPRFGAAVQGTIVLQDEGRAMRFRNIKIRRLQSD